MPLPGVDALTCPFNLHFCYLKSLMIRIPNTGKNVCEQNKINPYTNCVHHLLGTILGNFAGRWEHMSDRTLCPVEAKLLIGSLLIIINLNSK